MRPVPAEAGGHRVPVGPAGGPQPHHVPLVEAQDQGGRGLRADLLPVGGGRAVRVAVRGDARLVLERRHGPLGEQLALAVFAKVQFVRGDQRPAPLYLLFVGQPCVEIWLEVIGTCRISPSPQTLFKDDCVTQERVSIVVIGEHMAGTRFHRAANEPVRGLGFRQLSVFAQEVRTRFAPKVAIVACWKPTTDDFGARRHFTTSHVTVTVTSSKAS